MRVEGVEGVDDDVCKCDDDADDGQDGEGEQEAGDAQPREQLEDERLEQQRRGAAAQAGGGGAGGAECGAECDEATIFF